MNHPASKAQARKRKLNDLKLSVKTLFTKQLPVYAAIAVCLMPVAGIPGGAGIATAMYLYRSLVKKGL